MKEIYSHSVGLNFDIGHFFCVGEDPTELVYRLAYFIGHIHLADIAIYRIHNHLIPGEGAINLRAVLKAISDIGYDGFITVELYPYQHDPISWLQKKHTIILIVSSMNIPFRSGIL